MTATLQPREAWVLDLVRSDLPPEAVLIGTAMASVADELGRGVSLSDERLGTHLRISRGRLNAYVGHLRREGWMSRAPRPRRTEDEHVLILRSEVENV